MAEIKYPYLPEGRTIQYVPETHRCMVIARQIAQRQSLDKVMPTATLILRKNHVIGGGVNGSDYHDKHPCQRIVRGCKTGEGYELCEGCHPKNHSERKAIDNANWRGHNTRGADLYLWGHWWCCRWCWDVMLEAGINNVYLIENSEVLFNKDHPDNIVGKQFTA